MQFGLALDQLILTGSLRNPKLKPLVSYESNCRDPVSSPLYLNDFATHPETEILGPLFIACQEFPSYYSDEA